MTHFNIKCKECGQIVESDCLFNEICLDCWEQMENFYDSILAHKYDNFFDCDPNGNSYIEQRKDHY